MSVKILGLDYLGRGVARENGQVLFIEGALPTEVVEFQVTGGKKRFVEAVATEILKPSEYRVQPACPYYQHCGGCALQHLDASAELKAKEQLWREQLARIGGVFDLPMQSAIDSGAWRYRRRTRLAVHYDKQGQVVVGFRARRSHQVVGVQDCLVMDADLAGVLPSLSALFAELPRVQEVSLHRGETRCALAIQASQSLPLSILRSWVKAQGDGWQVWVNGECVLGDENELYYTLPEFAVNVSFSPDDFTQVNAMVNQALVAQAVKWVQPKGKKIMDFFAGLGNFGLPFAQVGGQVSAVEGVQDMVTRGRVVAEKNGLSAQITHQRADLFTIRQADVKRWQKADVWFLDPPRAGAQALVESAVKAKVERMVYVSCDVATLARDVKILTAGGYHIKEARVANMFARTAHIESIVHLERKN